MEKDIKRGYDDVVRKFSKHKLHWQLAHSLFSLYIRRLYMFLLCYVIICVLYVTLSLSLGLYS